MATRCLAVRLQRDAAHRSGYCLSWANRTAQSPVVMTATAVRRQAAVRRVLRSAAVVAATATVTGTVTATTRAAGLIRLQRLAAVAAVVIYVALGLARVGRLQPARERPMAKPLELTPRTTFV